MASTLLLINEAFLGALLVKLGYVTGNRSIGRVVVLSIHLSNTLLLLAALTLTALMLGTRQMWAGLGRVRGPGLALAGLLATLVVGVSGSLAALGDTLFPAASLSAAMAQDFAAGSPWLLRVRWVHPASAVVSALFVVWLVACAGWMKSSWVVGLLGFQFALGLADIVLLAPTWMQIVHLLGADLYWIALVILAAIVFWSPGEMQRVGKPLKCVGAITDSIECDSPQNRPNIDFAMWQLFASSWQLIAPRAWRYAERPANLTDLDGTGIAGSERYQFHKLLSKFTRRTFV